MPTQQPLDILKQGVEVWNQWRQKNPKAPIDLSEADLREADLRGAKMSRANLRGAKMSRADLRVADLRGADLGVAYLSEADLDVAYLRVADLSGANLSGANLGGTNLSGANLSGANLGGVNLRGTNLEGADLRGTNLEGAALGSTRFARQDLRSVNKLDTIKHIKASHIDFETTILPPISPTLATFLRSAGSSEYLIEALQGTILPPQSRSVHIFISFATPDQHLCQSLRHHLSPLERSRMITMTQEAVLDPEVHQWESIVTTAFTEAHILLALVSAPFIASHQAWKDILDPALHRQQQGTLHVIPVLTRPSTWEDTPLAKLQALPSDGKSITEWGDTDPPLTTVARGIRAVVKPLHERLSTQEHKRRERDLLLAQIIQTNTKAAAKQSQAAEDTKRIQQAQDTYTERQAHLFEAQRELDTLTHTHEALQRELSSLDDTKRTLHQQIHMLDEQDLPPSKSP